MTDHEKLLVGLLSATDSTPAADLSRVRYFELLAALASIPETPSVARNAAWN